MQQHDNLLSSVDRMWRSNLLFASSVCLLLLADYVNSIALENACPKKCTCSNRSWEVVSCASLNNAEWKDLLRKSPALKNTQILKVSSSNIGNLDLSALQSMTPNAKEISITGNTLKNLSLSMKTLWHRLEQLDLSGNQLEVVNVSLILECTKRLKVLRLGRNSIRTLVKGSVSIRQMNPLHIDLQHNKIRRYDDAVSLSEGLYRLDLSNNLLETFIMSESASKDLMILNLSNNRFAQLSQKTFNVSSSHVESLRKIDLSWNSELQIITETASLVLANLSIKATIDLNDCPRLSTWQWAPNLESRAAINLSNTKGWNCTCQNSWVARSKLVMGEPVCRTPVDLLGRNMRSANLTLNGTCQRPTMERFADKAMYGVGEAARLLCAANAYPPGYVIWTTNRKENLTLNQENREKHWSLADTQSNLFHAKHAWHWDEEYFTNYKSTGVEDGRVFIMQDGSLYIDYVTLADAGNYKCTVINFLGAVSGITTFTIKNSAMREVRNHSFIVAAICTGALLIIGFTIGLIKLIIRKCSEEERDKQKSISEMLEHLEAYRGAKMEQLREYKDWFRSYRSNQYENYNARMVRVKEGCTINMIQMQENYNKRIAKIKEQCDSQLDKLRESYNSQMSKIKDYKSHQVDRVREQYNQQLLRIRDYASGQLERLREQYKAQQAYLLKVMESMHIENCMNTEEDNEETLNFKLDMPDLSDNELDNMEISVDAHISRRPSSTMDDEDEYMTASDLDSSSVTSLDVHVHQVTENDKPAGREETRVDILPRATSKENLFPSIECQPILNSTREESVLKEGGNSQSSCDDATGNDCLV